MSSKQPSLFKKFFSLSIRKFYLFAVLGLYLFFLVSSLTYSMYTFTALGQETKEINLQIVYTLTFNNNGGSGCTSQTQTRESAWGTLCTPSRTGYNFSGWYTQKSGGTQVTSSTLATASKEVYARWSGKSYTVTFNNNGGNNSTTTKSVTYGSTYGTLPTPTKTGYTFEGWKLDDKTIASGSIVKTASNHTLVASYRANVVVITLNKDGGTGGSDTTVATYDSNLTSITPPAKEGYTFGGYYSETNGNGTKYFDENGDGVGVSTFTSTTTIYAKWNPIPYTITYTLNGGTVSPDNPTTYNAASSAITLNNPTKEGYTFTGWTGSNGTTPQTTVTIPTGSIGNKSYVANYEANTYLVQYNQGNNSPTAGSTAFAATSSHTYGTAKALTTYATLGGTAPSGWTFAGWSTSQTGTSTTYTDGQSISNLTSTNGATVNLYAVFKRTINVYSGLAEATNNSKIQYYNSYQTTGYITSISLTTPAAISGWTALGYRDDTDSDAQEYGSTASVTPGYNESKTYYAVYGKSCNATFYSGINKATSTTKSSEQAYYNTNTAAESLPDIVPFSLEEESNVAAISSWTKSGWRTDTDLIAMTYLYGEDVSVTCGLNFYSVYTRDLTISYNANGGTGSMDDQVEEQTYNSGGTSVSSHTFILSSTSFTKTGYAFSKWAEGSTSGTQLSPGDSYSFSPAVGTTTVTKTMYAIWAPHVYQISLNNHGANTSGTSMIYEKYNTGYYLDAAATNQMTSSANGITVPQKAGNTFGGYYTGDNGTGTQYIDANGKLTSNASTTYFTSAGTLHAKWTTLQYTVSFNRNCPTTGSGGQSTDVTATYGQGMPAINTTPPTCTGYTFMGWYDNATYTSGTQYYTAAGASAKNYDKISTTTLYGGWKDSQPPACRLDISGSNVVSSSRTDNVGVTEHGMSTSSTPVYNSTTSIALSANTFYGFVKDAADNTGQCSKPISSITTTQTCTKPATPLYTCTLTNGATANYSGTITCNKYTCSEGTVSGSSCILTDQESCDTDWTSSEPTGYTCPTVTLNSNTITPTLNGAKCNYTAAVKQYTCTRTGTARQSCRTIHYGSCSSGETSSSVPGDATATKCCKTVYDCPSPLNTSGQSSSTCTYYVSASQGCANQWTQHVRNYKCASDDHTLSSSTCKFDATPLYTCTKDATGNGTATIQCNTEAKYENPSDPEWCGTDVYATNTCTRTYTCSTGSPDGANCVQTNQTSCSASWTPSPVTGYSCTVGQVNESNCVMYEQLTCPDNTWEVEPNPSTCPTGARIAGTNYCVDDVYATMLDDQSEATASSPTTIYYRYGTNAYYDNINATGATITSITKPTKTGYTYGGHYTNTGGSGTQYINASGGIVNNMYNTNPTNGRTLYAKWLPLPYTLTISQGTGSTITVNRTSSFGGATGNLSNGDTIYYDDVLVITITANTGYDLGTHTVNSTTWTSGDSHTVTGDVTIASTATIRSYTITYNCNPGTDGTVSGTAPSNATVNHGSTATITGNLNCGTRIIIGDGTDASSNPGVYYQTGWSTSTSGSAASSIPITSDTTIYAAWSKVFTYDTNYTVLRDSNTDWRVKLLDTGTLTAYQSITIDAFLVGGGGSGASGRIYAGGGGGAGGYTTTVDGEVTLESSSTYAVTIGEGGPAPTSYSHSGSAGSETSAFGYSAAGGGAGKTGTGGDTGGAGGTGGSGGGAGRYNKSTYTAGGGGSYGSNGTRPGSNSYLGTNGTGQGTTTCEFGQGTTSGCDSGVDAYAGGGGGGAGRESGDNGTYSNPGPGGAGGGGTGGKNTTEATAGTANTGGGGGGGSATKGSSGVLRAGGVGGSGVVVIRNHRSS